MANVRIRLPARSPPKERVSCGQYIRGRGDRRRLHDLDEDLRTAISYSAAPVTNRTVATSYPFRDAKNHAYCDIPLIHGPMPCGRKESHALFCLDSDQGS